MSAADLIRSAEEHLRKTTITYPTWKKRRDANPNYGVNAEWTLAFADLDAAIAELEEPPPPPPPQGYPVAAWEARAMPNYQISGHPNLNQVFRFSTSPTTPSGVWGDTPTRNLLLSYSYEFWMLYEVWLDPTWPAGVNSFMTGPEGHTAPGDPGWRGIPGEEECGVAPFHFRFNGTDMMLQHEPNQHRAPWGPHEFVIAANPSKGQWHSVAAQIIFGRTDGSVPAAGHPNGGKGRTRVWWNGQFALDTGDVNTMHRSKVDGALMTRSVLAEGIYCPSNYGSNTPLVARMTISRWGRTLAEALADRDVKINPPAQVADVYDGTGVNLGPSTFEELPARSSADFVSPAT